MHIKIKNNMKGIDLSCASPASTAICSSIDQHSMVKNGTQSLHRLNSYIGDQYKIITNNIHNHSLSPKAPCISELPFTPRPSSSSYREKTQRLGTVVKHSDLVPRRRRSSADVAELKRHYISRQQQLCRCNISNNDTATCSCSHSSRYLLGESKYLNSLQQEPETNNSSLLCSTPVFGESRRSASRVETRRFESTLNAEKERQQIMKHFSLINTRDQRENRPENHGFKLNGASNFDVHGHVLGQRQKSMGHCKSSADSSVARKSSSSARSRDQVVVLRVSLHCKGCEGKLRKHLSKMEGVTSFSIDLDTKKVTVIGSVTPLDVLTSISKVKNAQFWPSPASTSSSSTSTSTSSSISDFN